MGGWGKGRKRAGCYAALPASPTWVNVLHVCTHPAHNPLPNHVGVPELRTGAPILARVFFCRIAVEGTCSGAG